VYTRYVVPFPACGPGRGVRSFDSAMLGVVRPIPTRLAVLRRAAVTIGHEALVDARDSSIVANELRSEELIGHRSQLRNALQNRTLAAYSANVIS